jgi:phytoene dehydrogenase-like protein
MSQGTEQLDAIIIGAGHNGLVAAGYLARAGKKVLVLEQRDRVGGACTLEESFPGFTMSPCAYVVSLLRPEIIRDLELHRYGFDAYVKDPQMFVPFQDGNHLFFRPSTEKTVEDIRRLSAHDWEHLPWRDHARSALLAASHAGMRALPHTHHRSLPVWIRHSPRRRRYGRTWT